MKARLMDKLSKENSLKLVEHSPMGDLVFLTGMPRAGKTFFTKLIHPIFSSNPFCIDYLVETFHHLERNGYLSDDGFKFLLSYGVTNHIADSMSGRRINLRPEEESSIFQCDDVSGSVKRALNPIFFEEDLITKTNESRVNIFLLHSALSYAEKIFSVFPRSLLVNVFSNPVDVIEAWLLKGFGDQAFYEKEPKPALPLITHNKKRYPIYASNWVEDFNFMSPLERVIRMVSEQYEKEHQFFKLRSAHSNKVVMIYYNDPFFEAGRFWERFNGKFCVSNDHKFANDVDGVDYWARKTALENSEKRLDKLLSDVSQESFRQLTGSVKIFNNWIRIKL